MVSPAVGGLPVAYGVCEALQAKRVYWAERESLDKPLRFRQYIEPLKGEHVLLADDILCSGRNIVELKTLLESYGAIVVALAVIIYQPMPHAYFGSLPLLHLARLNASFYEDGNSCGLCKSTFPFENVWS